MPFILLYSPSSTHTLTTSHLQALSSSSSSSALLLPPSAAKQASCLTAVDYTHNNCSSICKDNAKRSTVQIPQLKLVRWAHSLSCHRCGASWDAGDAVFKHIEAFKGTNWGDVLDAGTGFASMQWLQGVGAKSVTGITASGSNAERLNKVCGVSCQVIVGDWADPDTLKDRKFDTVLAEYLLGAVDSTLMLNVFTTLKMHMKDEGILIIVGTEPLNDSAIISEEEHMLARVTKVRDASLALSGKRAIKQFPLSFYLKLLEQSGLEVIDITLFPVVYGDPWISSQLSIASQTIQNAKTLSNKFASGLLEEIDLLKSMSSSEEGAFCYGADFVISAVIPQNISIQ